MNSNTYSITVYSIPCNINSYYSVITITVYQTYPNGTGCDHLELEIFMGEIQVC
jgi:hypothetical protein